MKCRRAVAAIRIACTEETLVVVGIKQIGNEVFTRRIAGINACLPKPGLMAVPR